MLINTLNIVNDRNSNRLDNVQGIVGTDLVGSCLQPRCLQHQTCFAFERGVVHPRGTKRGVSRGIKRYAYATEPATSEAQPTPWQMRPTTTTSRSTRLAA